MINTRRSFITGLGAAVGLVVAEPVRRYWAVGEQLSKGVYRTCSPGATSIQETRRTKAQPGANSQRRPE